MKIAIIGLGLIGGSIAKAIKDNTDHTVYGADIQQSVVLRAKLIDAIDDELDDNKLSECDLVIIALYPEDTVKFISDKAGIIRKGSVVIDCGGVKRCICDPANRLAEENGFTFIGGHPMAGVERSGFESSFGMLFNNASMILAPSPEIDIDTLHRVKEFFLSIGFGSITIVTPEKHDKVIAYTSQLAHVLSSSYIKSPTATEHHGMSAGSFKDMTRVATLNPKMWSELFIENKDNLVGEIDTLISHLQEYRDAINDGDSEKISALLEDGAQKKAACG